ncbi:MAG TPA: hypothetical protein V6C64_10750, partial [Microcoleaceae cyanobacterium]
MESLSAPNTQAQTHSTNPIAPVETTLNPADHPFGLSGFVIANLRRSLLHWYSQQGRDLPWRQTRHP